MEMMQELKEKKWFGSSSSAFCYCVMPPNALLVPHARLNSVEKWLNCGDI
jgi:hypothetical protein